MTSSGTVEEYESMADEIESMTQAMFGVLFVLGAMDPEMRAIESMLHQVGATPVRALCEGGPVTGRTAYQTDTPPGLNLGFSDPQGQDPFGPQGWSGGNPRQIVTVECGGEWTADVPSMILTRIDHHRPGDPGFGRPPTEFWAASSLGQVVAFLRDAGVLGQTRWAPESPVTDEMRLVAAADHCLGAAYAGQCPSVERTDLEVFRVAQRADWLRSLPADRPEVRAVLEHWPSAGDLDGLDAWACAIRSTYYATEQALLVLPRVVLASTHCPVCGGSYVDDGEYPDHTGCGDPYAEMGSSTTVIDARGNVFPELPEVLCRLGLCALTRMPGRNGGPAKIGIGGAGLGTAPGVLPVQLFMEHAKLGVVAGTKVDPTTVYGDPARGFAGVLEVPLEVPWSSSENRPTSPTYSVLVKT